MNEYFYSLSVGKMYLYTAFEISNCPLAPTWVKFAGAKLIVLEGCPPPSPHLKFWEIKFWKIISFPFFF